MPFDATPEPKISKELEHLERVGRLLASPKQWCKFSVNNGHGARCLIGALWENDVFFRMHVIQDNASMTVLAQFHVEAQRRGYRNAVFFNNAEETTHADILDFLQHVRERLMHA